MKAPMSEIRLRNFPLLLLLAGPLAQGCSGDGSAGPAPARANESADASSTNATLDSGEAADGGPLDAETLCGRACTSTARAACPRAQPLADCVSSCRAQLARRCTQAMAVYLRCLADLAPAELECDEAGAPRAKPPACADALVALARCLTGP